MDVNDLLRRHEGTLLYTYDDATGQRVYAGGKCVGTLTAGIGHTGKDVIAGMVVTAQMAEEWLFNDRLQARSRAIYDYGGRAFYLLDEVRQAVLTDMAFCLGGSGLLEFSHMLGCIRNGDWVGAKAALLDSEWARTEAPNRAAEDAEMLLTGNWPA
jgi:GH24 family phage-related lysozyme (muramidase)